MSQANARSNETPFETVLAGLSAGLSQQEVREAFDRISAGDIPDVQIGAFLFGLSVKGESVAEVSGIADSLMAAAPSLQLAGPLLDIVGTGGDRTGMVNISTPASVLAVSVLDGVTVVKHGNRGATTPTGSADVIEAWGIPLDLSPTQVAWVGANARVTFCFAPVFHGAMRYAAAVRRTLNVPTVMNVLGPLINPASPDFQLVGVADPGRVDLICRVLEARGVKALVARGHDGLDKFTLTGPTDVVLVGDGGLRQFSLSPEDVGLSRAGAKELMGSTPRANADRLLRVLDGSDGGPVRDVVMLNAAAAAVLVNGAYDDFPDRLRLELDRCRAAIESGAAIATLRSWIAAARSLARERTPSGAQSRRGWMTLDTHSPASPINSDTRTPTSRPSISGARTLRRMPPR